MLKVIQYLLSLKAEGYIISFELNHFGTFTAYQSYNEMVNGRRIHQLKKKKLISFDTKIIDGKEDKAFKHIEKNLIPDGIIEY